jgi:inosine-uridine nucleoside N-ribohydrolase
VTHKILLDTDIGSDIDDAVCLAYLLARPDCDLLGITTVTGEGEQRARIASALCRVAGRETPIYVGAESPLIVPQRQPFAPQAAALGRWPHATNFPRGEAVEFLRRTIRAHPGEVILLTIGPLTNIALLFAADPSIPALLKGLVIMGGQFWSQARGGEEWNLKLDPHAAAIVYRAAAPAHRSVGLDVTTQVALGADEVRQRFAARRLLRPVLDLAEVFFREEERLTFHDPLAAATLFDPGLCDFQRGTVTIELADPTTLGKTYWTPGGPPAPHEVAVSVDAARFFAHYFGSFAE